MIVGIDQGARICPSVKRHGSRRSDMQCFRAQRVIEAERYDGTRKALEPSGTDCPMPDDRVSGGRLAIVAAPRASSE